MRLRCYYEYNLRSFFISKKSIKTLLSIPMLAYWKISIRHLLEVDINSLCLVFWILLFLTRQKPTNPRNLQGELLSGFYVTLRGNQFYIFLDKFTNFIYPLGSHALISAYHSYILKDEGSHIKFKSSCFIAFHYKNMQEYLELAPFMYIGKASAKFLRDLWFYMLISVYADDYKLAVNLIHMFRLPLKFRLGSGT